MQKALYIFSPGDEVPKRLSLRERMLLKEQQKTINVAAAPVKFEKPVKETETTVLKEIETPAIDDKEDKVRLILFLLCSALKVSTIVIVFLIVIFKGMKRSKHQIGTDVRTLLNYK